MISCLFPHYFQKFDDDFIFLAHYSRHSVAQKRKVPILLRESTGTCECTRLGFDGATDYFLSEGRSDSA
jgi:hypothetical protein